MLFLLAGRGLLDAPYILNYLYINITLICRNIFATKFQQALSRKAEAFSRHLMATQALGNHFPNSDNACGHHHIARAPTLGPTSNTDGIYITTQMYTVLHSEGLPNKALVLPQSSTLTLRLPCVSIIRIHYLLVHKKIKSYHV